MHARTLSYGYVQLLLHNTECVVEAYTHVCHDEDSPALGSVEAAWQWRAQFRAVFVLVNDPVLGTHKHTARANMGATRADLCCAYGGIFLANADNYTR